MRQADAAADPVMDMIKASCGIFLREDHRVPDGIAQEVEPRWPAVGQFLRIALDRVDTVGGAAVAQFMAEVFT